MNQKTTMNSIGMKFVLIPEGSFLMGYDRTPITRPVHRVAISSFWMGMYSVTNIQFERFKRRPRPPESLGDNQPVTRVTFKEATDFCAWLSHREKKRCRLPTEAEWEYAARGGLEQKDYPWGNEDWRGRARFGEMVTSPVGSYAPNGFGLYDMAGNVEQWVSDWYSDTYYAHSPGKDPKGPDKPKANGMHITRGGSSTLREGECWLRYPFPDDRSLDPPLSKFHDIHENDGTGFRVVIEV